MLTTTRTAVAVAVLATGVLAAGAFLYAGLHADRAAAAAALDEAHGQLAAERTRTAALAADNAGLAADNTALAEALASAGAQNEDLAEALASASAQNEGLAEALANAGVQNEDLAHDLATARDSAAELWRVSRADLRQANADYRALAAAVGTLEQLSQRVAALEAEIEDLTQRRRPLLLDEDSTRRTGAKCTGSMEPALTCLDERTWLHDFRHEDIVVGAIISFNPNCWEDEAVDSSTVHRVKAIEVRNGVHYYWPKGDSNREADGCWVPEQHVNAYLIEVHRNARPENAELRDAVNAAKVARHAARDALDGFYARHCPARFRQSCALSQALDEELDALATAAVAASATYWCWHQVALDSEYPGHIPRRCGGPTPG